MPNDYIFGAGSFWAIPSFDALGNPIANPTPQKFGTLQDFTVNFNFTAKELYSRFQIPVAAARGSATIAWTAKYAQINAGMFHAIYFGNTGQPTAGAQTVADQELHSPIGAAPYNVPTTFASSYVRDLGVQDATSGAAFQVVQAAPATGQYVAAPSGSPNWLATTAYAVGAFIQPTTGNAGNFVFMATVAGTSGATPPVWPQAPGGTIVDASTTWLCIGTQGTYLFAAADTARGVLINYVYQTVYGYRTAFVSQQLGNAPLFSVIARGIFLGAPVCIRLDSCVSGKLSIPRVVDDWVILTMDGQAFVGPDNITVGSIYLNSSM